MIFLLCSILCSVAVSVLLKLAATRRWQVAQLVTWNYLAAALLCFLMLRPSLSSLFDARSAWLPLAILSIALPSLFIVLSKAIQSNGIVRTDVAQRLSLVGSLAAAFVFFGESFNALKLAGSLLGLGAVVGILLRPDANLPTPRTTSRSWHWLLLVWAGFAVIDVMLKQVALAGASSIAVLQVVFVIAFGLMFVRQHYRHHQRIEPLHWRNLNPGLLLGVLNFGNIFFYIRAHQAFPDSPSAVFAAMNIGVVVIGATVGILIFGERTRLINRVAIIGAIIAILLIKCGQDMP